MAEAVPVCDVLCEAAEYLSKLGMNLKVRTDNLKEKKIRREKLKNTHAVQKAANKVLLICELSKKSLENVEAGVKTLLQKISSNQGLGYSAKKTCYESDSNIPFEYFEYESKQLKIREKIFLKHYMSVNVAAKPIPLNLLEKYPVYYDCNLYQSKKKQVRDKTNDEKTKNVDNNGYSTKTKHLDDDNVKISSPVTISKIIDNGTMELENNDNNIVNTNFPSDFSSNQSPKTLKNLDKNVTINNVASDITVENNNCEKENDNLCSTESNVVCENSNKSEVIKNKYNNIKGLDDHSDVNEEENETAVLDSEGSIKVNNENDIGIKSDGNCPNLTNARNESGPYPENNLKKNDLPLSSNETKTFIKCVNINKLLEVPEEEKDVAEKNIDKVNIISEVRNYQIFKKREEISFLKKANDKKYCKKDKPTPKKIKSKIRREDNFDNNYLKTVRKKSFKPKEFCICLQRLPNFSENFLVKHNLEKITQNGSIIFELNSILKGSKESEKTNCDSKTNERDLLKETESIKNTLLNDSNSDSESDKEKNGNLCIGSTMDKNESTNIKDNLAEENKNSSDCNNSLSKCDENAKNMLIPSDNVLFTSENHSHSDHNEDPEKIKSLLLNDSSDGSSSNARKDENEEIVEDLKKVKTSLLNNYSDSSPTTSQKRKRESDTDSSSKSKRKQIMESMHAKKMLLTYSSSSDTDDGQLRDVFKEIKEALLKKVTSDEGEDERKTQSNNSPKSDSENEVISILRKDTKVRNKISSSSGDENYTENFNTKKKRKHLIKKCRKDKIDNTKSKLGSRSSQNSDSQDANDKDIDGLTNLNTLSKSRRRRLSSTEQSAASIELEKPEQEKMPKAPRIKTETLLKAETSSDATSIVDSDEGEEDITDLPTVSMSTLNGEEMAHLAKDDLLQDSDSLSSHEDKSQEDTKKPDTDVEDNIKTKRRKGNAISSGSEAGSSRRRERGHRLSDFEDSDDEGSEPAGNKKRKKKSAESDDNSSVDSSKKKRRRIKNIDDSDASDSDTENEGRNKHGRKNIRKVMGKNQLEEATKKAARQEKERIARIAERQKVYNNLEFDESGKPDEVILEKVVLDFDPETKEPLIEVDRGLVKKLKPHQANGIKFMWDACFESVKRIKKDKGSGCILAHCMGLGKTLQVVSLTHTLLTHSDLTKVNRVLVVCPLSTVLNWVNEFRIWLKHTEKEYDVDVYELSRYKQNSERAFQLQQWFEHGGVCVLGYEMFRNLSADNTKKFKKKMLKNFQESLVDPGPDLVVCDEGHLLKNEKTSLSQSMNRVKTLRRIVLTGTPLQNNLKEYYCMVQFVKPNLLGKYNEYLNRFVNPITNGQYTDSTEHDIRVMKRRSHVLHKMLDGAVQRRDYGVLAPFLPPKHEYVLFITLTEVQIKLYQHYLDNYSRRPLPGKSSGFLFPDFQSLQRIWTHPLVLKYNSERYEIMQQKKREREEEDSEGSLVDFIDDDSTPEESTSEESSEEYSDVSDDSRKKSKKKKSAKKGKVKDNKVTTRRGTRANPVEQLEEDVKPLEVLETKYENPTEWWIKLVTEDELEDMRNSHKLVLLFDILRQCETIGDKLLVFSQSLYSLDLIEHFLGKVDEASQDGRIDEKLGGHVGSWSPGLDYFRLDGSTSCENRSIWCKNFNKEDNPRARLFLISTRAGGLGINLVAANRVVIFDVSWNPSHDVQSIFRVYRFGQKKPCYIYRFLAMGTMEEKIYERQVTKQAISKRVIDEQQIDRHYAENDLAELYKFSPRPPTPRPLPSLPRDRLFAEMLREHDALIYKFHEHDSLLENKEEETLSEEERKAAWEDFENEKNRPPPAPFPAAWQMPNGMVPGLLAQQQQQLAFAALGAMLRKDMPNITENQIREMLPLIYSSNPGMFGGYDYGLLQKMGEIYKYAQPGMMNAGMMNPVMNPGGVGTGSLGGASGLQYEPPWQRQQQQQQQMRLQQLLQQQHQGIGAKYYAGGLGSRDPVAMALQQQRAREIMLGERGRPRGRPPLHRTPPASDIVNLADSD